MENKIKTIFILCLSFARKRERRRQDKLWSHILCGLLINYNEIIQYPLHNKTIHIDGLLPVLYTSYIYRTTTTYITRLHIYMDLTFHLVCHMSPLVIFLSSVSVFFNHLVLALLSFARLCNSSCSVVSPCTPWAIFDSVIGWLALVLDRARD